MSPRLVLLLLLLALMTSGCPNVEAVRRARDEEIARRLEELEKTARFRNQKLLTIEAELTRNRSEENRLRDLVRALEKRGPVPDKPPYGFVPTRVAFSFLTCAIDQDGKKGDDAIAAYVSIYDQDDSGLKVAGSFRFELFDLARSKDHVIQSWSFTPEEAARYWQKFPPCYQFKLPFGGELRVEEVVLKVTFRQAGKKELTARKELTVELP